MVVKKMAGTPVPPVLVFTGASTLAIFDSAREFQETTSDLNHGRVERSTIPPSTETTRGSADGLHPRIPRDHLRFKPRTWQTELHHFINRDERACVSIPVTAFKTSNLLKSAFF
jgi:hypothetical protein